MSESWKAEVITDKTGNWLPNGLRFATPKEAREYVWDMSMRWSAVQDTRVVASDEPVNYCFADGKLEQVKPIKQEESNNG